MLKNKFLVKYDESLKYYSVREKIGATSLSNTNEIDIIILTNKWPNGYVIECRWQGSNGSTKDKNPLLVDKMIKYMELYNMSGMLLLGGCKQDKKLIKHMIEKIKETSVNIQLSNVRKFNTKLFNNYFY